MKIDNVFLPRASMLAAIIFDKTFPLRTRLDAVRLWLRYGHGYFALFKLLWRQKQ